MEQYESPWVVLPGDGQKMWSELRSSETRLLSLQNQAMQIGGHATSAVEDNVTIMARINDEEQKHQYSVEC